MCILRVHINKSIFWRKNKYMAAPVATNKTPTIPAHLPH